MTVRLGKTRQDPGEITSTLLREWPLPEGRGRTLIVAGSAQMPGAAILASLSALRAGAGQMYIATARSVASTVALAVPESRIIGLRETPRGGVARLATAPCAKSFDAMLVGPGLQDADATARLVQGLRARCPKAVLQLDSCAIGALENESVPWDRFAEGHVLITPQPSELASLTGMPVRDVAAHGARAALKAARQWRVTVMLKGVSAHVATPDGRVWSHPDTASLRALSGAGDVLSGIVVGLLARGCSAEQAAVWGLGLYTEAGDALASSIGPVGYLARELADQIPSLLCRLAGVGE